MEEDSVQFEVQIRRILSEFLNDNDGVLSRINVILLAGFRYDHVNSYAARICSRLAKEYKISLRYEIIEYVRLLLEESGPDKYLTSILEVAITG